MRIVLRLSIVYKKKQSIEIPYIYKLTPLSDTSGYMWKWLRNSKKQEFTRRKENEMTPYFDTMLNNHVNINVC